MYIIKAKFKCAPQASAYLKKDLYPTIFQAEAAQYTSYQANCLLHFLQAMEPHPHLKNFEIIEAPIFTLKPKVIRK